jgi:hypothetical protein
VRRRAHARFDDAARGEREMTRTIAGAAMSEA